MRDHDHDHDSGRYTDCDCNRDWDHDRDLADANWATVPKAIQVEIMIKTHDAVLSCCLRGFGLHLSVSSFWLKMSTSPWSSCGGDWHSLTILSGGRLHASLARACKSAGHSGECGSTSDSNQCMWAYVHPYKKYIHYIHSYTYIHITSYAHLHAKALLKNTVDPYTCAYIHTISSVWYRLYRSYIHTYVHTYIHTYIHTYMRTYIHTDHSVHTDDTYVHACIHNYLPEYIHSFIHSYRLYLNTDYSTYIRTGITYIQTMICMYVCMYVYMHVYLWYRLYRSYIHTYIHTYRSPWHIIHIQVMHWPYSWWGGLRRTNVLGIPGPVTQDRSSLGLFSRE